MKYCFEIGADACFCDLRKAFDKISHTKLASKLTVYGVNGIELDWFLIAKYKLCTANVYPSQNHYFLVYHRNQYYDLFVIFFNDIVLELLNQSKIIKHADDTVIFFSDKDYNKVERALCSDMDRLSEWFTLNQLLLNLKPGKTELLVFDTNRSLAKIHKHLEVT